MIRSFNNKAILQFNKEILKENDVFDCFLPDGGAFMFFRGCFFKDLRGDVIISLIEKNIFFKEWFSGNEFCWYLPLLNSDNRKEWEKLVFINRLYFLLPLAHRFYCTGDEKYALMWIQWFNKFNKEMMPKKNDKFYSILFRDMQVAWRLLVVTYSYYFLKDSDSFSRLDKKDIFGFLEWHCEKLYNEANLTIEYNCAKNAGNHFEQKGLALLAAGLLFKGDKSEQYIDFGRKVLRIHIKNETFADGGNVENCPSYSAFIVRMQLDAYLLLKRNGYTVSDEVYKIICMQYKFLYLTSTTDLKTLQINDSFSFNIGKELRFVNCVFPLDFQIEPHNRESVYLKDSGFVVLRNDFYEVYLTCKDNETFHYHYGGPQIVIYKKGKRFLIDGGCVNYDLRLKEDYLHTPLAHNVVIPLGIEHKLSNRDEMQKYYTDFTTSGINYVKFYDGGGHVEVFMNYHDDTNFTWKRAIDLSDSKIEINDEINSQCDIGGKLLMHFDYGKLIENNVFVCSGAKIIFDKELKVDEKKVLVADENSNLTTSIELCCIMKNKQSKIIIEDLKND